MMCRSRNVFVLAWLGLLLTNMIVQAQDDINFTSITVKDGLSSNTVNAIVKDQYGLIWFGTTNGLVRYDGSNFHTYRHEAGNVFSLAGNEVQTVYQGRRGMIWTGTNVGGIYYYDRKYDRFVHYTGDGSWPQISNITVRSFLQDHNGNLWVGTYGDLRIIDLNTGKIKRVNIENPEKNGNNLVVLSIFEDHLQRVWIGTNMGLYLYQWKTSKLQHFAHDPANPASLSNNTIKSITEDTNGNLWCGTYEGLDKLVTLGHFRVFRHNDKSAHPISNDAVWAIAAEKAGKLWIGTEGGINIFDPVTETFKEVGTDLRNNYRLRGKVVHSLLIDTNGIYWVGTYGGGVGKYDRHLALFNIKQSNPFDPLGLKSPIVTAFAPYKEDAIFIGTDGAGIQTFNLATGLFKPFTLTSKINPSKQKGMIILSMYKDSRGYVWAGTYQDGLFQIDPKTGSYQQFVENGTPNGISINKISSLAEDDKRNIWIGTIGKGVDIYNPVSGSFSHISRNIANAKTGIKLPSNDYTTVIKCAPDGDIWIGSSGTGIAVYHTKTGTFTQYSRENSGLVDNVIQCMFFAKDQTLWIGTNQGVSYFDPKTQRFISYGEKDGLANGFVKTILEDNDGLLWFSTDKSITSFDRHKKAFRNFTGANGAIQSAYMVGAGMKTANGELYFGGQDGFNYFNPAKLPLPPPPGPVLLTDLKIGNMSVLPDEHAPIKEQIGIAKEIRVKYGQNFSLSYVSLDYTSATQSQYAYRLSGYEKEWNFVHQINTANYTNIDPGTYTFEVKATNSANNWKTPVKAIKIVVLPPFWRTGYAYFSYLLLVGTLLWAIRRRAINKLKKQFETEREKMHIRQMIEQERKETERLHELDNLKIKFLTDLSHEFRTPISLIAAPVEKLLKKYMEEDDADHLKMISRNVRRLLNLVNQLLDFRKMEEHGTRLNPQPGNIINFITEAADSFRDIAEKKQITLQIEIKGSDCFVLFDFDKLERIVFNLLSNAFKFTPKGGQVLLKTDIGCNGDQPFLIFTISDTGVGVPEKDLDKIFDRFFQTNQDKAFLNQGTGIGLAITKEFVELHGGKIWAETLAEKGTKFIVEIPLAIVPQVLYTGTDPKLSKQNSELSESTKKNSPGADNLTTVLLVEDNDEFREYLIEHLQQFYHIVGACDGREGWQKTLSIHPQLVVTDISMPQMSGIELSKKIRADKRTSHIPIILLTAMTGEEDQLKGLKSGANDYLTKPFNFQILNARIENLLNLNKSLKDAYSKQIHLVGNQIETESAELKLLNKVMNYVEEKLSDCDLSVEELSKFVGMSRASLYYKLIELTGLPPTEYIRTIKLDKAASLIETSDLNISQIAYMTGFATPSYFSKMFKGKFGMSPSEYLNLKRVNLSKKNEQADILV